MITSETILKAFDGIGLTESNITLMDSCYSFPTLNWVETTFADAFRANLNAKDMWAYVAERNDCNQFALQAWADARAMHVRSTKNKSGLAFGMMLYQKDGSMNGHAINVFLFRDHDLIKIAFWEPQTYKLVNLSEMEISFGLVLM